MFRPLEITYNCTDLNNKIKKYRTQAEQVIEEIKSLKEQCNRFI